MDEREMTTSLYESEAEQTRERIASTVDNLQSRLSPRNMMSGAMNSLSNNGTQLVDSARRMLRDHPVALSLVGLSVGLLLMSRNRTASHSSYAYAEDTEDTYSDEYGEGYRTSAYSGNGETYADNRPGMMRRGWERVRSTAGNASSAMSDRASSARDYTSEKWQAARERTADYAERARERAAQARERAGERFDENPLGAALIGLAAGAIIGALLPRTRRENEFFGDTSDRISDAARNAARAAADAGRQQLDQAGLTGEQAKSKLADIGSQAAEIARSAAKAGASEIRSQTSKDSQGRYNA